MGDMKVKAQAMAMFKEYKERFRAMEEEQSEQQDLGESRDLGESSSVSDPLEGRLRELHSRRAELNKQAAAVKGEMKGLVSDTAPDDTQDQLDMLDKLQATIATRKKQARVAKATKPKPATPFVWTSRHKCT